MDNSTKSMTHRLLVRQSLANSRQQVAHIQADIGLASRANDLAQTKTHTLASCAVGVIETLRRKRERDRTREQERRSCVCVCVCVRCESWCLVSSVSSVLCIVRPWCGQPSWSPSISVTVTALLSFPMFRPACVLLSLCCCMAYVLILASHMPFSMSILQAGSCCLGELVQKMADLVLPVVVPILTKVRGLGSGISKRRLACLSTRG